MKPADAASYVARQASTVGRRAVRGPAPATIPVPELRGASGACLGRIDEGGGSNAGAVALGESGRMLFLGGAEGALTARRLPGGSVSWRQTTAHARAIHDIAVSPDGRSVATAGRDGKVRVWSAADGRPRRTLGEDDRAIWSVCWSPDGERLVAATAGGLLSWHADGRAFPLVRRAAEPGHGYGVGLPWCAAWSPAGDLVAVVQSGGYVSFVEDATGRVRDRIRPHADDVNWVRWSPDGRRIATGSDDRTICVWDPSAGEAPLRLEGHASRVSCVVWSPGGQRLASASGDRSVRIWDPATGAEVARHDVPEEYTARLSWSPDGAFLVSSHSGDVFRLWDTRPTLPREPVFTPGGPVPPSLSALPGALALLLRHGRAAPLSLLLSLLALTGGLPVEGDAAPLASHPGMRALVSLRWPTPARVAFLLILLQGHDDPSFAPPPGVTPSELRWLLLDVLGGPVSVPVAPPTPVALLERSLASIHDGLLTLLEVLGPEACAADPSLPLSLLSRVPDIRPLAALDRRLLSLRVPSASRGRAERSGAGGDPAGFSSAGRLLDLVPSQWALPAAVRLYRALVGGLLYRARSGREAPRLPPMVIVLDTSPACFGPVEVALRGAAHAAAASLVGAGLPGYLVAAGGENAVFAIEQRADLVQALSARSREPVTVVAALGRARALAETLRGAPVEPVILLLSHPWFGADEDDVPSPPRLRGLFAAYPRHPAAPALGARCERSTVVMPEDLERLGDALANLLG